MNFIILFLRPEKGQNKTRISALFENYLKSEAAWTLKIYTRKQKYWIVFRNLSKKLSFYISLGSNINSIGIWNSAFWIKLLSVSLSNNYRTCHVWGIFGKTFMKIFAVNFMLSYVTDQQFAIPWKTHFAMIFSRNFPQFLNLWANVF